MSVFSQNPHVEVLPPKVMVLGGEGFGSCFCHEGRAYINGSHSPYESGPRNLRLPSHHRGHTEKEAICEPGNSTKQTSQPLDCED